MLRLIASFKIAERDTAFLNSVGLHKYSSLRSQDRTLLIFTNQSVVNDQKL
jgi:hypothetical protein